MQETDDLFIAYGDIATGFIGYVYIVFLLYQPADGTAHGDDIVIRMGREYHNTLRIGFGSFRTIGVIGIRLAARPSCNGMLEVVEYLDVHVVGRAVKCQQFTQTVFVIIFVGQFQNGLFGQLAEPDDGASYQFVVPFAGRNQPGALDAGQIGSGRQVGHNAGIVVCLQVRGRYGVGSGSLYTLFHHVCFLLTPSYEIDFCCIQYGRHTHGDGTDRGAFDAAEGFGGFVA